MTGRICKLNKRNRSKLVRLAVSNPKLTVNQVIYESGVATVKLEGYYVKVKMNALQQKYH